MNEHDQQIPGLSLGDVLNYIDTMHELRAIDPARAQEIERAKQDRFWELIHAGERDRAWQESFSLEVDDVIPPDVNPESN